MEAREKEREACILHSGELGTYRHFHWRLVEAGSVKRGVEGYMGDSHVVNSFVMEIMSTAGGMGEGVTWLEMSIV